MRHHHAWLDANGMPAYLEASSPRSRDLYAKHGYLAARAVPGARRNAVLADVAGAGRALSRRHRAGRSTRPARPVVAL